MIYNIFVMTSWLIYIQYFREATIYRKCIRLNAWQEKVCWMGMGSKQNFFALLQKSQIGKAKGRRDLCVGFSTEFCCAWTLGPSPD
jgi:hypothetical protein